MANVNSDYLNKTHLTDSATHVSSGNFTGCLYGVSVGLFTNSPSLNNQTLLADLVQPVYDTYATQAVTWNSEYQDSDNSFKLQSNLVQFQLADITAGGCTASGYFVQSTGGSPKLLWSENFANPIALATTDDSILISAQFRSDDNEQGSGTVIS